MSQGSDPSVNGSHEESYKDHMIFIEPNRDHYTGGFEWFVSKDDIEVGSGLEFTTEAALTAAREQVNSTTKGA